MKDRTKNSAPKTRVWTPRGSGTAAGKPATSRPRPAGARSRPAGPSRPRRDGGRNRRSNQRQRLSPKERRAKQEGFGRLYIDKQIREKTPMVFETYDRTIEAVVLKRLVYDLDLLVEGEKERLNKLPIKFMYKKKDEEAVRQGLQYNEEVRAKNLEPVKQRDKRFKIDTRELAFARQNRVPIRVTLRGGEVFTGTIDWYSHFEIKMSLGEDASVVVFRHAAYDFALIGAQMPPHRGPARRGGGRDRRPPRRP